MKNFKYILLTTIFSFIGISCEQEMTEISPFPSEGYSSPSGSSGSANFAKFATIGGSYTAGMMDGALHNFGQSHSVAKLIANQLAYAGGASMFYQPDINSANGYVGPGPDGIPGTSDDQGRTYLTQSASTGAIGIDFMPGDIASVLTPYGGDKTALNNFAFPNSVLAMYLTPYAGGPNAPANPAYNPFFARFDASGATVHPLGQFIGSGASFFMTWLGHSDFLGYAARGGDQSQVPIPDATTLGGYFQSALGGMLAANPVWKGVVGTVPDLLAAPYFQFIAATVAKPTEIIPMANDATLGLLQGLAAGFNQLNTSLAGLGYITAQEAGMRTLSWSVGANSILVEDETLTDLGPLWDALVGLGVLDAGTRAALNPFRMARQAFDGEILPLSAQVVIGVPVHPSMPTAVYGVTVPLPDQYFLTGAELYEFEVARQTYNAAVAGAVAAYGGGRVAVADFNGYFESLAGTSPFTNNNVVVTYDFAPPTGMWSTDGIHPNARGYALVANKFIAAINDKFGASVPSAMVGSYTGAALPVTVN